MSIALESANVISALKSGIEAVTGESHSDLTAAVQALKNGYGASDNSFAEWFINTFILKPNEIGDVVLTFQNAAEYITYVPLLDMSEATDLFEAFRGCYKITSMAFNDTSNVLYFDCMCYGCAALETIGVLDFSSAESADQAFFLCYALKNIDFVAESIGISVDFSDASNLTDASIKSIFDGLSPNKASYIILHSDVLTRILNDTTLYALYTAAVNKGWTIQ